MRRPREFPEGAAEIGEVLADPLGMAFVRRGARRSPGMAFVDTAFGGRRVMDLLAGDPLPRIC